MLRLVSFSPYVILFSGKIFLAGLWPSLLTAPQGDFWRKITIKTGWDIKIILNFTYLLDNAGNWFFRAIGRGIKNRVNGQPICTSHEPDEIMDDEALLFIEKEGLISCHCTQKFSFWCDKVKIVSSVFG